MPTFIYKARDTTGRPVKGTMDAANKEELVCKLHKMGYMTTYATESLHHVKIVSFLDKIRRISVEDMVMFNIQLANMVNAGITLLASLDTLTKQIDNRRLKETIVNVSEAVESGEALSQALSRHHRIFPPLFISMVKAGEASGQLDIILTRYAAFCEHQEDIRQKIRGALFYPTLLMIASIAVVLFIVTSIIPQFAKIFIETGVPLPLPTLILYKVGMWIKDFWYLAALVVALLWFGVIYIAGTEKGRLSFDRFKLKPPVFGSIYRKTAISRFARTLGILLASGVPILQALDIVKEIVGNEVLAGVVRNARTAVERGERIAGPLRISREFPPDTVQMIAVGEETGNLDKMLDKISDFYDRSLDYTIRKLTTIIEPLFLIVMGAIVGFIMASLILPIFDMLKVLRK